ncbi:class I SAM-dependent methyltransferase [Roseibacillus ishigakijimensis]|uniref:Class I SAM-dependent methyltransferase n=1 Tax=Roseibacillus ishigakijimensis TaxID=454146 RepID=A0A934RL52_9BACT|nr:class I SAM-dependent methyltransferase [Roseibacillus ishigakijimensis]MBK1833414.1 class I SAM-dependent methyltransferase [Roseibacillus ishigakijimensis]
MKSETVKKYYDKFSEKFEKDVVYGNLRVEYQKHFLKGVTHPGIQSVLIIGAGYGDLAPVIRKKVGPEARILGLDISSDAIDRANKLFSNEKTRFRVCDICADEDELEGTYDLIIFPDCYEHLPRESRPTVHRKLAMHSHRGTRIVLTVPSLSKQAALRANGEGLQIVDEDVSVEDCLQLAKDVDGYLASFQQKSIWKSCDYYHILICVGEESLQDRNPTTDGFFMTKLGAFSPQGTLERRLRPYRRLAQMLRERELRKIGS